MCNNVRGGSRVLFGVGAAVSGGTSLFGGRGKAIHGVLGGLVIGGIYNGMYLQGLDVEKIFIVTGLVLLAAVSIDAVSRRAPSPVSAARACRRRCWRDCRFPWRGNTFLRRVHPQ